MLRLSIIVVATSDAERLERTLESVLRDRPVDCEILVVHPGTYDDPYGLQGEVEYVEVPPAAGLVHSFNAALAVARGDVIHVLPAGTEVEEGWTERPLARFTDPQVGSVVPLMLDAANPQRVHCAGIRLRFDGTPTTFAAGSTRQKLTQDKVATLAGPSLVAAFYRRSAIDSLNGFHEHIGARAAAVDLAVSLRSIGYSTMLEPTSCVYSSGGAVDADGAFREGRYAERLYWLHAPARGWLKSVIMYPMALVADLIRSGLRTATLVRLCGRAVGFFEAARYRHNDRRREEGIAPAHRADADSHSEKGTHRRAA